jgi:thiamine biosynthesis lipoprotein
VLEVPRGVTLRQANGCWVGTFEAMASPCQVHFDKQDRAGAARLLSLAVAEAQRIERKFSRYRQDSAVQAINTSRHAVEVDEETARLIAYADRCYRLSGGLFDITSGVLRRVWRFDGSDRVPGRDTVQALLPLIGWDKVRWEPPRIALPAGMEIDLGGIGKEYAVDRVVTMLQRDVSGSVLVNFGGDLRASGPRSRGQPWSVAIEDPQATGAAAGRLALHAGALATSGDARRFLLKDNVRYGHILDPRTGWPIANAPRSVTVLADTCTTAGLVATLAMLSGAGAEAFLERQGLEFWCVR